MASSSSVQKTRPRARSASFPSQSNHLSELNKSKAVTLSSSSSSPSSSISQKITSLKDMHTFVDNMLLLPTTRKAFQSEKDLLNELLDELLRLLDLSTAAKDALLMTRDSAQQLQSVLRRKRGDSIDLTRAVQDYQSQRKTVKKTIVKASSVVKGTSVKNTQETPAVVALRQVGSVTLNVLESLLFFILGSNSRTNSNKWSLVSKLIVPKHVSSDDSSERSQVEKVDAELAKKSTGFQAENVQKELAEMEMSLEGLQEGLECIYRHLIKTRVSLLNLLNC